jgi:hypothetical protein
MQEVCAAGSSVQNYLGAASPDLSFSRTARHRTYSCDPGLPYDLHRVSSISIIVCASLRCCSIAWPAGESGGTIVVRNRIKARNGMPGAPSEKEKQDQRHYAHFTNYRATGSLRQLPDRALSPIYRSVARACGRSALSHGCVRLSVRTPPLCESW